MPPRGLSVHGDASPAVDGGASSGHPGFQPSPGVTVPGRDVVPRRLDTRVSPLQPATDAQRTAQATAVGIANEIGQTRWLMFEQRQGRLPGALLVGLVAWLAGVFLAFGLFSPRNPTVVASLLVSAVSVTGAIFLILEMYAPYSGIIQVTNEPIRAALEQLGR
jgi:hypothetical protein